MYPFRVSEYDVVGVTPPLVRFCTLTDKSSNIINTLRDKAQSARTAFCAIHMLFNTLGLLVLNVQFLTNGGVTPFMRPAPAGVFSWP